MTFTRRQVLTSAAALAMLPRRALAAMPELVAAETRQQIAPDGYPDTAIWSYGGGTPGPEIRVLQGARVARRLVNRLPQPTAVHWHGIRIDNAMDGVPGLTQEAVTEGASFDYDFTVPDAGTYWYHSHNRSMEQVARGLYGALIVDEPQAPDVDRDIVLMLDDWRLDPETAAIDGNFDNGHDLSHAGRFGNLMTVNGRFDPAFEVKQHERLRLRLVNAANARVFEIGLDGLEGWIVALDGMPLDAPLPVGGAFALAPAQRADLFVDVTAESGAAASLLSIERDGGYGLCRFDVSGQGARARRNAPAPLPANPLPEIGDLAAAPLHEMRLQGGAMRWLESARLGETEMSGQELAQLGKFWALNGRADRPDTPFLDAARGSLHRIAFVNETNFDHGMHLHGHHFRLIGADGAPGPWRDTVLVPPRETRQIALVADNPGRWLLHCHMLGHAMSGMTSWFRVA
ncbi:multicopper oxidase family protein [Ruegeria marina]|uniref:Multicopper oxidase with three cupredoxin domains (Includes cell division protein FtsP and spore coat protein CotA) n=1 Tax=Ruegeria marina TaxID=639004 RepID=A0A1G6YUN2_9RHOB|nr:multicopper oxidase family protein [Ruegeria marina]SDD94109.1 Multicopper oxidase with three cupredoxin domains (includes cell division protein FtsP and spore coat protein CotA) [Ruegeria marina]